ncbi:hypothetical protein OIU76_000889 [Salix suchowensis]|nr:hypothetical protein OIU76_000889 [Salix suchowensis]
MSSTVRKRIQKKFKIRGYTLRIDALDPILSFTNRFLGAEDEALDLLLDHLQSQSQKLGVKSSILDKGTSESKQFYEHTGGLHIHGDASAKAALYKDRFLLLYQRVLRDSHFSKPAFHTEMSHYGSCEIAPIQSLVGQMGRRWVMGVISQLEDGHFYLEDLTASVEIDLSKAISFGLTYFFSSFYP